MTIWQKALALIFAFLAAGAVTFGVNYYFEAKNKEKIPEVFVLVSKESIPVGKKLMGNSVTWQKWGFQTL